MGWVQGSARLDDKLFCCGVYHKKPSKNGVGIPLLEKARLRLKALAAQARMQKSPLEVQQLESAAQRRDMPAVKACKNSSLRFGIFDNVLQNSYLRMQHFCTLCPFSEPPIYHSCFLWSFQGMQTSDISES